MSNLEEVDVSENIKDDEEIQLSEPEENIADEQDMDDEDEQDDSSGVDQYIPQQTSEKTVYEELEEGEIPEQTLVEDDEDDEIEEGEIYEGDNSEKKKLNQQQLDLLPVENDLKNVSSSDEDSDEEDDLELQKIEKDINKSTLLKYHPELKQINYKELLTLSKVTRNKKGIIIDPLHKTIPFLTRYEKAKILGLRAKQINNGSDPFVEVPRNIINGHTIAQMELDAKKIPFIIKRPIPNGGNEYWKVSDLQVLE